MSSHSHLFDYFARIYNREITAEEKELISCSFKIEIIKKKQLIFSSGEKNTRHYFIEKGLLRMYVIDSGGKEFNILFASENQWIGDLATPAKTSFFLDAVEKSVVYSISDENMNKITKDFSLFVKYIKASYIFLQKRLVSILVNTAEQNHKELTEQYPDLISRLPQYHISSYLGVTPVFLSKILSKKAKEKD
jgi:CRP-like cAMP-binding protein